MGSPFYFMLFGCFIVFLCDFITFFAKKQTNYMFLSVFSNFYNRIFVISGQNRMVEPLFHVFYALKVNKRDYLQCSNGCFWLC